MEMQDNYKKTYQSMIQIEGRFFPNSLNERDLGPREFGRKLAKEVLEKLKQVHI
jgi:hypothetical protein